MNNNNSSTDAPDSEKVAADTQGDSPTDQQDDFVWPWYDAATWGAGNAEIKGYVTTRHELYQLARKHAGELVFIDFLMHDCYGRDLVSDQAYAEGRLDDICRLIGSALTDQAIRDAVQVACHTNRGKEDWERYVNKRLRWLPSPWGLGEQGPPPDAWLDPPEDLEDLF